MTDGPPPRSTLAVVVPFYQTKRGILPGVIESALAQRDVPDFQIIVVDDGSPVPALEELAELIAKCPGRIRIIEQSNAGPGAARNKGLDHVPEGTRYVAFLDSDDFWKQNHLCRALQALEQGYDFYFSDFFFATYKQETAFNRAKKINPGDHKRVAGEELFEYVGDLFNQVFTGNVIGTPTVVYRYEKFPRLRFREEFFNGQDYLFWLDFSLLSEKIAFSSMAECDCGLGLNIYTGSDWGAEKSLSRLHNEIKLWRSTERFYKLTPEQQAHNDRRIDRLREVFIADILHRLRRGKKVETRIILNHIKVDPIFLLTFLPTALRVSSRRLKSLSL